MERASRLFVLASLLIAGAVHAWLASGRAGVAPAIAVTFAAGLALGRFAPDVAIFAALATTYVAPALLFTAFAASDYHTMAIWLAPLVGIALTRASWARWHIPDPWRFPFVAWALVIAVSWPIVAWREIDFSLIAARTYDTTNSAYNAPPRLAAAWILIVALSQLTGILWFDLLWARYGRRLAVAERIAVLPLVASAAVGSIVGVAQAFLDVEWLNLPVWARLGRAGALMLDANTAGIAAAMWGPAAIALAWRLGAPVWLGLLAYVLSIGMVWAAGSRTALLAIGAATAGIIIAAADRRGVPRRRVFAAAAGGTAILLALALVIAPRTPVNSPVRRIFDRLPSLEAGDASRFAREMWTRFGYGSAAVDITADHPIGGVGVGAFHVVAPDYMFRANPDYRAGRALPTPDNAQNWWRHQIAELGLAGALPSLWGSGLLLVFLCRRGSPRADQASVATVVSAVLIGVGLASLLGVPTQHPATWLSVMTLLFWIVALSRDTQDDRAPGSATPLMVGIGLAVVSAASLAASATSDLRVPNRAFASEIAYSYGLSAPEGLSEYGELRWMATRAVRVMPVSHQWLRMTMWAPHADLATRPVQVHIRVNHQPSLAVDIRARDPLTVYVRMPDGAPWALLEAAVSRDVQGGRALQVAMQWVRDVPTGVPADLVGR